MLNKFAGLIMVRARRRTYGRADGNNYFGHANEGDDYRTAQHVLELRKLLRARCKGPYSEEISEFALVLRVGGHMQEFDFEGCQRVRRNRREKFLLILRSAWTAVDIQTSQTKSSHWSLLLR